MELWREPPQTGRKFDEIPPVGRDRRRGEIVPVRCRVRLRGLAVAEPLNAVLSQASKALPERFVIGRRSHAGAAEESEVDRDAFHEDRLTKSVRGLFPHRPMPMMTGFFPLGELV